MKNNLNNTIMITLAIGLAVISLFSFIGYRNTGRKDFINYQELSDIDYTVCFKQPNDFYSEECLSKNINNYVTAYINYININFNYKLKLNRNIDSTYKYGVIAKLTIFDRNNTSSIMNEKNYTLVEDKEINENNINEIEVNELVKINYDEYNKFVTDYKSSALVQAAANLRIIFHIETANKNKTVSEDIKSGQEIAIDIPLNEATISLKTDYLPSFQSPNIAVVSKSITNTIFLVVFFVTLIASVVLLVVLFILKKKINRKSESVYDRFINKLKNDYDSDITNITSLIDAEDEAVYEYLDVQSFKEIYEVIKTSTEKKIIWNERKYYDENGNIINRVSWFFVFVSEKNVMRLVIDENKFNRVYQADATVFNRYRG